MKLIGLHAWEPALTVGNTSASSGGGTWMQFLIDSYFEAGHDVAWVTDGEEKAGSIETLSVEDATQVCDLIICFWRWQMPAYPERNALYLEQKRLLELSVERNTRVVVYDGDHMIAPEDWDWLRHNNIHTFAPELAPRQGVTRLLYPNPYPIIEEPILSDWWKTRDLIYVGNNYGRFDQTVKFLSSNRGMNPTYSIELFGNWLDPHPERQSPEEVRAMLPNVEFSGRLPQQKLIETLNKAYYTVHLFKESYGPTGFVTMRWAEAAAAGALAFVPDDFFLPYEWADIFKLHHLVVKDAKEMAASMSRFSRSYASHKEWYNGAIRAQANFVKRYMTIEPWFKLVTGEI